MEDKKAVFSKIFLQSVGKKLELDVSLSKHCNFGVGGKADYFFQAKSLDELITALKKAIEEKIDFRVIGGGYNIIFDDNGFRGLIIKNKASRIKLKGNGLLEVDAGTSIADLVEFTRIHGLSGLEFMAGIPGTVGGAVYGNAGAFGEGIGSRVQKGWLISVQGKEKVLKGEDLYFGYRWSILKSSKEILLKVLLLLRKDSSDSVAARINENLKLRKQKLPPSNLACGGSFFKNPELPSGKKVAAAYLLEQVGAKGIRLGGAVVYKGHANFIYNRGGATAGDIMALSAILKERVKKKFGIELEEEVNFLPANPSGS